MLIYEKIKDANNVRDLIHLLQEINVFELPEKELRALSLKLKNVHSNQILAYKAIVEREMIPYDVARQSSRKDVVFITLGVISAISQIVTCIISYFQSLVI